MTDEDIEQYETLCEMAGNLSKPVIDKSLEGKELGDLDKESLRMAAPLLEQALAIAPAQWATRFHLALCQRLIGEQKAALESFRRAYVDHPVQVDVGREYANQCFKLGLSEEGLVVSRELHERFPENVGVHANYALALILHGDVDEALAVGEAALIRDLHDRITLDLVEMIRDVKAGRRKRPTHA